jgi:hypothetical protein
MGYSGSNPTLKIQGLIYLPRAIFTVNGAIDLHSGGLNCLGVIARQVVVGGNGAVFEHPTDQCVQAGLYLPAIPGTSARQALVQ